MVEFMNACSFLLNLLFSNSLKIFYSFGSVDVKQQGLKNLALHFTIIILLRTFDNILKYWSKMRLKRNFAQNNKIYTF